MIMSPRQIGAYTDRGPDCAFHLMAEVHELARRAVRVGWTSEDVAAALTQIATHLVDDLETTVIKPSVGRI